MSKKSNSHTTHLSSPLSKAYTEKRNKHRPLTCIDLFAGAGGFSLAAKAVGIRVAAAVELNKNACKTYRANIAKRGSRTTLYDENILDIHPEDLKSNHFSDRDCDIVLGGPPCQGFSIHRINGAGVGDPRNKLILRYFEFVATLRPKVFLMENVPGILWPRHKSFLDEFYEQGETAGYKVMTPVTLDARDYGVPQRRKRVFILGVRADLSLDIQWPPNPTHGDIEAIKENKKLKPWRPAAVIFENDAPDGDLNNLHMNHSAELIEAFKSTPLNGGSRNQSTRELACHAEHDGHWDVYGRINPLQPGPTMTTACINPSKGRFVHPTEHHGITVRQAARFQTFPDSFVFHGGLMSAGEQIGNAVPVKLGQVLLAAIKRALRDSDHKKSERGHNRSNKDAAAPPSRFEAARDFP